jgi:hypothetical protein
MAKAMKYLGTLSEVTPHTQLVPAPEAQRVIETVDAMLAPLANKDQAMMLWAELISCYPDLLLAKRDADRDPTARQEFVGYTRKMVEAFQGFSHFVGKQIVDARTGLPSTLEFRPKPADVRKCGAKIVEQMTVAKTMAQRHIKETKDRRDRRAKEAEFNRLRPSAEDRKRQAEEALQRFRGGLLEKGLVAR